MPVLFHFMPFTSWTFRKFAEIHYNSPQCTFFQCSFHLCRHSCFSSEQGKGKINCTLVQALRLCTGRKARRGSRGIALLFHDHGTRRGWGVSVTPRTLFTAGKDPLPIVQEAGWAPGPVWRGAENIVPTGIRSPDRPVLSQSLYQLSYPAHNGVQC